MLLCVLFVTSLNELDLLKEGKAIVRDKHGDVILMLENVHTERRCRNRGVGKCNRRRVRLLQVERGIGERRLASGVGLGGRKWKS